MTEPEARAAAEILRADFPVCEAVIVTDTRGHRSWAIRTYGKPASIDTADQVGRFIVRKITETNYPIRREP